MISVKCIASLLLLVLLSVSLPSVDSAALQSVQKDGDIPSAGGLHAAIGNGQNVVKKVYDRATDVLSVGRTKIQGSWSWLKEAVKGPTKSSQFPATQKLIDTLTASDSGRDYTFSEYVQFILDVASPESEQKMEQESKNPEFEAWLMKQLAAANKTTKRHRKMV